MLPRFAVLCLLAALGLPSGGAAHAASLPTGSPVPVLRAGQPPTPEPRAGTATYTDLTGGGSCSFPGEPAGDLHVGLASAEYGQADVCGAYLDVTGPAGTVRVQVTDHCRRCPAGLLDLSRTAFAAIAPVEDGRVAVSYALVRDPPLAEPIALRVKAGSSPSWLQIQALDHGNPLAGLELQTADGWRSLTRTMDNFWTAVDPGPGAGPFTVRLTDVVGRSVTIPNVALAPDEVQRSAAARFYPPPAQSTGEPASPTTDDPTTTTTVTRDPTPTAATYREPVATDATDVTADRSSSSRGAGTLVPLFAVLLAAVAALVLRTRWRQWAHRLSS